MTVFSPLTPASYQVQHPAAAEAGASPAKCSHSLPHRPAPPAVGCTVAAGSTESCETGEIRGHSHPGYPEEPALPPPQPHPPFATAKSFYST